MMISGALAPQNFTYFTMDCFGIAWFCRILVINNDNTENSLKINLDEVSLKHRPIVRWQTGSYRSITSSGPQSCWRGLVPEGEHGFTLHKTWEGYCWNKTNGSEWIIAALDLRENILQLNQMNYHRTRQIRKLNLHSTKQI